MNGAGSRSANAGDVKKVNNCVDSTQNQWACSPYVPDYLLRGWNLPSLTASVAVITIVDDMNDADSRSANAGDVKKVSKSALFDGLCCCDYQCWQHEWCRFAKC
jgi:hypothetical protein